MELSSLSALAKENTRLARDWLDKHKIPYELDQRGRHPCFVLTREKRQTRVTFSGSPSIYSGDRVLKDVKAAAQQLGYIGPSQPLTRSTYRPTRRQQLMLDPIEALARKHRVHVSYHHGGKHPYMIYERDGGSRKQVFSSTSSDHRATLNALSTARSIFAEAGWAQPQEEKPVVGLVSTGKGSMFDAQHSSQGPASPVKVIRPSGENEIVVSGVPMPKIPEIAKKLAGAKTKGPPAYQAFLKQRNVWIDAVFEADPKTRWEDVVAALELGGYKTTIGAVQQALRVYRIKKKKPHKGIGVSNKKRIVFPKPQVTVDMAAQLRILRDPPHVPDFARRKYEVVTAGSPGAPFVYRQWGDTVRYPWAVTAFNVGATIEQVAESLRRAGHPITDNAAELMERRWRREAYEAAEAAKPKPAPKLVEAEAAEASPTEARKPKPEGLSPMGKLLAALTTYIDDTVSERMGGLDIDGLKKKAAKWDAYQQVREAKRKMAELDGDED